MYYYDYKHLLEHLYWKHGTESVSCTSCNLRMWKFCKHFCHVLPIDDVFVENYAKEDVDKFTASSDEIANNDVDKLSSCSDESDVSCSLTVNEFEYTENITVEQQYDPNQNYLAHPMVQSYLKYSANQAFAARTEPVYCYCRKHIENTQMIGCDEPTCAIQWYHFSCVGIRTPPDGEWLCPTCRAEKCKEVIFTYMFSLFLF